MTKFNFDESVDRRQSHSVKWDKYPKQTLPLWIADTDFKSPPCIIDALQERVQHGIFGYTRVSDELNSVICQRMMERYQWTIEPSWIVWVPSMVNSLNLACRATGSSQTAIVTAKPVYPPIMGAAKLSDRRLITTPIIQRDSRWVIDFDALEKSITDDTKLLIFCNPHNPGGTVYRNTELEQLIDICQRHKLTLCSDEIHCDLILEPNIQHIPAASLESCKDVPSITLMAPSKTFNIAGLGSTFAIIPHDALRRQFKNTMIGIVPDVNLLALTATLAAYKEGDEWHRQQLIYLKANRDLLIEAFADIDQLELKPFEATYLAWVDASKTGLSHPAKYFAEHGVGLSEGKDFGQEGFVRINFGCTRATLIEAIARIKAALTLL